MHFLTNGDDGSWYLTHEGQILDVVMADNHPVAALEVAHLVPGAGEWERLNDWMYFYRPMPRQEMALATSGSAELG